MEGNFTILQEGDGEMWGRSRGEPEAEIFVHQLGSDVLHVNFQDRHPRRRQVAVL